MNQKTRSVPPQANLNNSLQAVTQFICINANIFILPQIDLDSLFLLIYHLDSNPAIPVGVPLVYKLRVNKLSEDFNFVLTCIIV